MTHEDAGTWERPAGTRFLQEHAMLVHTVVLNYATLIFAYTAAYFLLTGLFVHVLIDKQSAHGFLPGFIMAAVAAGVYMLRLKQTDTEMYRKDAKVFYPLAILSVILVTLGFGWGLCSVYDSRMQCMLIVGCPAAVVLCMLLLNATEIRSLK
jgi:amino acid transporter